MLIILKKSTNDNFEELYTCKKSESSNFSLPRVLVPKNNEMKEIYKLSFKVFYNFGTILFHLFLMQKAYKSVAAKYCV